MHLSVVCPRISVVEGGGVGFGFGGVTVKATQKTFTSVREIDIQNFKSSGKLFIETQPSTVVSSKNLMGFILF